MVTDKELRKLVHTALLNSVRNGYAVVQLQGFGGAALDIMGLDADVEASGAGLEQVTEVVTSLHCEDCGALYSEMELREYAEACNFPEDEDPGPPRCCERCANDA